MVRFSCCYICIIRSNCIIDSRVHVLYCMLCMNTYLNYRMRLCVWLAFYFSGMVFDKLGTSQCISSVIVVQIQLPYVITWDHVVMTMLLSKTVANTGFNGKVISLDSMHTCTHL